VSKWTCPYLLLWGMLGVLGISGCNEPGAVGRFRATPVTNIILNSLGVIDEEPEVFVGYRDPEPKDLIPDKSEYVIGPGDMVDISIMDLFSVGREWVGRKQVSETGRITLPEIGTFRVTGRTELELTDDLVNRLSPHIIKDAVVNVVVVGSREKVFSISGAIRDPGRYPLTQADYRISEAMAAAGGIPQVGADYAYVIRKVSVDELSEAMEKAKEPGEKLSKPVGKVAGEDEFAYPGEGQVQEAPVRSEAETQEVLPGKERAPKRELTEEEELLESITPGSLMILPVEFADLEEIDPVTFAEERASGKAIAPESALEILEEADFRTVWQDSAKRGKSLKVIRKGNRFLIVPAEGEPIAELPPGEPDEAELIIKPPVEPALPERVEAKRKAAPTIDELGMAGLAQELIRIDLKRLRGGDLGQNIIIRTGDDIHVPYNSIGFFSVMGQVARPGTFALGGQRLTLKQALASAGPMTALAEPSRCELTRRIGANREVTYRVNLKKLFAGAAPDVFLKEHDIINVGTHPLARWMAVIRQSFRSTYGFGFVYDRNMADKDFGR